MATITLTRGKTLPNSGVKSDLHDLVDLTTAAITNIVNADVSSSAAILGTKISPNFGAQDVTTTGETTTNSLQLPQTTAPATAASEMAIYAKDTSGQPELFVREESSGDEVQITNSGHLSVVCEDGTIAHGATIPLPSGIASEADAKWIVSVNNINTSAGTGAINKIECEADGTRVVTCRGNRYNWVDGATNTWVNGTANYIIMGV